MGKIVWSSRTEDEETPQCSFMFVNRQLIVYTSSSSGDEEDRSIVWHSKPPPSHSLEDAESSFLVLENDGILSIYFHSNGTSNPYHDTTTTTDNNEGKLSFPFFGKSNSTRNIIPFVNTQQRQIYCTKASQLWNTCYQKAIQKVPIIDIYSKKAVHAIQKVAHQTNPAVKRITNVWQESYQKTMLSIQNAVIKLTQTSIYHPKGDNSTNLLCIWS